MMSGIAGIFSRSGQPVDATVLERMVALLSHRGPDGSGCWHEAQAGLGHRMLWTTPESLNEKQPWSELDCTIAADARLDNRAELIRKLALDFRSEDDCPDSRLILLAYAMWGKECAKYLLGDFAFAIWDARTQEFFCARDPIGVKPFYYFLTEKQFGFASEMKAILATPQVPKRLNEEWLLAFFVPGAADLDKTSTFFQDIQRLPPAHSLVVSSRSYSLSCYWALDPDREIRLKSDQEYAEAFRECFTEAVRSRLRSAYLVGSTLSGGLDFLIHQLHSSRPAFRCWKAALAYLLSNFQRCAKRGREPVHPGRGRSRRPAPPLHPSGSRDSLYRFGRGSLASRRAFLRRELLYALVIFPLRQPGWGSGTFGWHRWRHDSISWVRLPGYSCPESPMAGIRTGSKRGNQAF